MNRLFAIAGILGGLGWIVISIFPPEWGPPGTRSYEYYQAWNRLWTPALLLMTLGFLSFFISLRPTLNRWSRGGLIALLVGFGMMMIGNVAEFWIFTSVPYSNGGGPNVRDLAWETFLLGMLVMLIGGTVAGLALFRTGLVPKWLAGLLALLLPLTIGLAAINMGWTGIPIGSLAVVVDSLGLLPGAASSAQASKA